MRPRVLIALVFALASTAMAQLPTLRYNPSTWQVVQPAGGDLDWTHKVAGIPAAGLETDTGAQEKADSALAEAQAHTNALGASLGTAAVCDTDNTWNSAIPNTSDAQVFTCSAMETMILTMVSASMSGYGSLVPFAAKDFAAESFYLYSSTLGKSKITGTNLLAWLDFSFATDTDAAGKAAKSANLSDLANTATARDNLGLGTAAVADAGDFAPFADLAGKLGVDSPAADLNIPALPTGTSLASGVKLVVDDGGVRKQVDASNLPGAASGEANTISSVGGGTSLVSGKVGVDLQVNSINSLGTVAATDNGDSTVTLDVAGVGEAGNSEYFGTDSDGDVGFHALPEGGGMENPMTTEGDIIYGGSSGAPTRLAAGTAGQVLTMGTDTPAWETPSGGGLTTAQYSHAVNAGTQGGTATSGSWQTRTLNTEDWDDIGINLASNQMTLPAGTYLIDAWAAGYYCGYYQAKLYNVTGAADIALGSSVYNTLSSVSTRSTVRRKVTFLAETVVELQFRVGTTAATEGWGVSTATGFTGAVYAEVFITKL